MRSFKLLSIATLFIVAAIASTAFINAKLLAKVNADTKGFAVVELFTSEGCSSCPPADELIAKIEKESKDKQVYILAYHVDYWDRLGWKDSFSDASFTARQNEYAGFMRLQSVYTPQAIVNGKTEFVGSEEGNMRNAISKGLQTPSATQLGLKVAIDQGKATINYTTEGADKKSLLLVAFLQKNATSVVKRGENSGKTLSHVQIVRKLQKVTLKGDNGSTSISLPSGFDSQSWEIIGFVQNTSTGVITGATKATYSAATAEAPKNSK